MDRETILAIDRRFIDLIRMLGPANTRELSIAITNVEQGLLWFRHSVIKNDSFPSSIEDLLK